MLPTRAYADNLLAAAAALRPQSEERAVIIIVAERNDVERFPSSAFTRMAAHTTTDALALIARSHPRVVALDWDMSGIDRQQIVQATKRMPNVGLLVAMSAPEHAPQVIKNGCHAVLLKPFPPNLAAARIGRLCRELPSGNSRRLSASFNESGTHRVWPDTACPHCQTGGATSFEFSSYRRMWYACLACEHVWLGARQE
jgi:DNA-binding response OmpR family regulator